MIHSAVFCPFERVTSIFLGLAAKQEVVSNVTISFPDFGVVRSFEIAPEMSVNRAMGVSQELREKFMRAPVVEGLVTFTALGKYAERKFVVTNRLVTFEPAMLPTKDLPRNGTSGLLEVTYPEARDVCVNLKDVKQQKKVATNAIRPFYNYLLRGKSDDVYYIDGPANLTVFATDSVVVTNDGKFSIGFVDGLENLSMTIEDQDREVEVVAECPEPISSDDAPRLTVLLTGESNGRRWDEVYTLSQNAYMVDGRWLDFEDQIKIWRFMCFAEIASDKLGELIHDGYLHLHVVEKYGRWVLADDAISLYDQFVRGNAWVNEIFGDGRVFAGPSSIMVRDLDGNIGNLTGIGRTLACFAMSLAMLMSLMSDGKTSTFIKCLLSLIDQGWLTIQNGVVVGNTARFIHEPGTLKVPFGFSTKVVEFHRDDVSNLSALQRSGFCLFGFDPENQSKQPGPDHYVVAYCNKDDVTAIFDPIGGAKHITVGTSLKTALGQPDSALIVFSSENVASSSLAAVRV